MSRTPILSDSQLVDLAALIGTHGGITAAQLLTELDHAGVAINRVQLSGVLQRLQKAGKIHAAGLTRSAKWFGGPGPTTDAPKPKKSKAPNRAKTITSASTLSLVIQQLEQEKTRLRSELAKIDQVLETLRE
mgnify:CR=1 FL=1